MDYADRPEGAQPGARPAGPARLAAAICALTLLAALPLVAGYWQAVVPHWYNSISLAAAPLRLVPGALAVVVYVVGLRLAAGRRRLTLLWSLAGAVAVPVALLAPAGNPFYLLFTRTVSAQATGGFTLGMAMTPEMLQRWPELMPGWRPYVPHIAISPPGWPLLYYGLGRALSGLPGLGRLLSQVLRPLQCHNWDWALNQASDGQLASAWFGIASPFWAACTVIPLYLLGRRAIGPGMALTAVSWWPLVPALAAFAGTLSTVYPALATMILYLTWLAMDEQPGVLPAVLFFLSGVIFGGLLLLNLSLVPLLLLVGLLALLAWQPGSARTLGSHVLWCGALGVLLGLGVVAVILPYGWLAGHSPCAFNVAMGVHTSMDLPYALSVGLGVWDLAVYLGLPAAGLALAALWGRRLPGVARLAWSLGLTLAMVLLSGFARGEVGRVWIFFMPALLLLSAASLQRMGSVSRNSLMACQILWLVVLTASNRPVDTWLGAPPAYGAVAQAPLQAPSVPVNVTFGDEMRLVALQSEYRANQQALIVALHWQALHPIDRPYYFSIVPVAPNGQARAAVVWQPLGKAYPTTCWPAAGQAEIVDQVELPLGSTPPTGNWWLSLSAFAIQGDRALPPLPAHLPDGQLDRQAGLGPIPVGPSDP